MNKFTGTILTIPKMSGNVGAKTINIGGKGDDGATFIPSVSDSGIISWTNDKDLPNPEPVNIKGKDGKDGADGYTPQKNVDYFDGKDGADGKTAYQYANDGGYTGSESDFAMKLAKECPTKLSELTNDKGYITSGEAPVQSVNGKTGSVTLDAAAVGARPSTWMPSASDVGALPSTTKIPSKTSELTNDSGFITEYMEIDPTVPAWAKETTKPSYTKSEVGLGDVDNVKQYSASNPPPYPVISVNGNTGAVNISVPTKTSELTNNSGFITKAVTDLTNYYSKNETYTQEQIKDLISAIPKFSISVVSTLPTSDISTTTVYLVKSGSGIDLYTEYIYVDGDWEILGSQRVDLTGYATENWVNVKLSDYLLGSELSNAINTALAQAKASGEFDGKDGSDAAVTAESVTKALGYVPANVAEVFEYSENPTFTNLLDDAGIEYGKLIDITGQTVTDTTAALATTGFIPIRPGDIGRVNEDFPLFNSGSTSYILYDANRNPLQALRLSSINASGYYVSLVEADSNGYIKAFQVNKPSSVAYIRICNNTMVIGSNPILTVNEEIRYEMGYGQKLNPAVKVEHSQIVNAPGRHGWSILPHEHLNIAYSSIGRNPINTVEHFADAAENFGYNVLKCDVRPTSDGELVCCHDAGFTFNSSGKITTYDSANATAIRSVTAATVLGYSFPTGEHPCLVGDFLDICRKYGKVAFVTIRNEYMDVVIPKLLEELRAHNMTHSTIINCMTYESLVQWRQQDTSVMINYTLNAGVAIDQMQIDRVIGLGYCSLCGFGLTSSTTTPNNSCDFEYARANGIRLLQAVAYKEGSPEACYAMGYDGCQIGYAWNPKTSGSSVDSYSKIEIDAIMGSYITDISNLVGGDG